jgi:RNA polymerase sigma-70 factor (ECF subfamily)
MNKYEKLFKDITGHDFESYYNEHKPSLTWYIAKSYTKDMEKAEEFANQAFMQSLEKIETYNKEKSLFKTWLTKIAINLVIKDWKDNHKYNFISLERDTEEAPSILNILHSDNDADNDEQDDANKKKCELVYEVINNLPDKYKKVMVMRELEHMAYKDIADSIKKEIKIKLNNQSNNLENPEDFFSLELHNIGIDDIIISYESESGECVYELIISSNDSFTITRDDIAYERGLNDTIIIDSTKSECVGLYITTTNLSTIKSQIKKGRELILKKVKRKFETINENGVNYYSI